MVQRERKTLASAKRMMTKLRGDETWIPCDLMYSRKDETMFDTGKVYNGLASKITVPRTNRVAARSLVNGTTNDPSLPGSSESSSSGTELGSAGETITGTHKDSAMEVTNGVRIANTNGTVRPEGALGMRLEEVGDQKANDTSEMKTMNDNVPGEASSEGIPEVLEAATQALDGETRHTVDSAMSITGIRRSEVYVQPDTGDSMVKGEELNGNATLSPTPNDRSTGHGPEPETAAEGDSKDNVENLNVEEPEGEEAMDDIEEADAIKPEPRRMRTRAQAQAASEPTTSSRTESPDSVPPQIHPLFKIPELATPDKDFGLPLNEADETRRLLTMYVQKQEEVCRGAAKLYEGLLRADRQRSTILKWCKAEGHVGEMSDGEDWYDKEEWDLEEDLEKGHNDEEGDNNTNQGRKPRRRA